jgi:hypothetical protein
MSSPIVEEPMKKIKRWLMPKKLVINTSPKIKMSELISEYASDYINMGEDTEDRQNYLNGACTAWNIAILDEKHREGALRGAIDAYKKMNPGADDVENFELDLRILIQKKLETFPDIKKVLIDAMIEPICETKYRITIASTDDKDSAKEIFKMRR